MKKATPIVILIVGLSMGLGNAARADFALSIQLTGLNLSYNGSEIYDTNNVAGGAGLVAEATPLATLSFFGNGNPIGTLTSNIFADVDIVGAVAIPAAGGPVNFNQGSIFDLLSSSGRLLSLDFAAGSPFSITYDPTRNTITGQATASRVFAQNLPFLVTITGPVTVNFTTTLSSFTSDGTSLTSFASTGSGGITASAAVPEPGTALLLAVGVGLCGLGRFLSRPRPRSGS